jgi:hypothetical protein
VQCVPPRRTALRGRCRNARRNLTFEKPYDVLCGLPQVVVLAALLGRSERGRGQTTGNRGDPPAHQILKPARTGHKRVTGCQGIQLHDVPGSALR